MPPDHISGSGVAPGDAIEGHLVGRCPCSLFRSSSSSGGVIHELVGSFGRLLQTAAMRVTGADRMAGGVASDYAKGVGHVGSVGQWCGQTHVLQESEMAGMLTIRGPSTESCEGISWTR